MVRVGDDAHRGADLDVVAALHEGGVPIAALVDLHDEQPQDLRRAARNHAVPAEAHHLLLVVVVDGDAVLRVPALPAVALLDVRVAWGRWVARGRRARRRVRFFEKCGRCLLYTSDAADD